MKKKVSYIIGADECYGPDFKPDSDGIQKNLRNLCEYRGRLPE